MWRIGYAIIFIGFSIGMVGCSVKTNLIRDNRHLIEVSIPQQQLAVYRDGVRLRTYPIATSKYGYGDEEGSYKTPLGKFEVARKIGGGKPSGAVFKQRRWTGEILEPDSPGRDPIVSRILWLNGLEEQNKNAFERYIYIHGTAAEKEVGYETSYGCVRMFSEDIIELYDFIGLGTEVDIVERNLWPGIAPDSTIREDEPELSIPVKFPQRFANPLDCEVTSEELRPKRLIPPPPVELTPPSRDFTFDTSRTGE